MIILKSDFYFFFFKVGRQPFRLIFVLSKSVDQIARKFDLVCYDSRKLISARMFELLVGHSWILTIMLGYIAVNRSRVAFCLLCWNSSLCTSLIIRLTALCWASNGGKSVGQLLRRTTCSLFSMRQQSASNNNIASLILGFVDKFIFFEVMYFNY